MRRYVALLDRPNEPELPLLVILDYQGELVKVIYNECSYVIVSDSWLKESFKLIKLGYDD